MSSAPFLLEVLGVASPHRRDRQVDYYFCRSAEVTRPSSFSYGTKRNLNVKVSLKGQSANCSTGLPDNLPAYRCPLPFLCESRGTETRFINLIDPEPGPSLWTARRRQDPCPVRHRPPLGGVRPLRHLRPGLPAGAGPAGSQARIGPAASTTQAPAVAPTAVPTQPDEGGTPGWLIALLVIIIGGALLAIVIALIVRNRSR